MYWWVVIALEQVMGASGAKLGGLRVCLHVSDCVSSRMAEKRESAFMCVYLSRWVHVVCIFFFDMYSI